MDTIIQEASKGSPILAYGSSSLSPKKRMIFLGAGILAIVIALFLTMLMIFFLGSASLPSTIAFAVATSPASIDTKLNGALITELPAPWRAALESNTSLPVVIGLAKTKQGSVTPFAIVPKIVSIAGFDRAIIKDSGLIKMISSEEIDSKKTPYRTFQALLAGRKHADAGWMINEELLQMLANSASEKKDPSFVYGSINGMRGEIFLPSEQLSSQAVESAFFVTIGKQNTPAHLISNALLYQGIDVKDIPDPDQLLIKGDGTLSAAWSDLSEDEKRLISIASEKTTSTIFELPDKDTVKQIAPIQDQSSSEISITDAWKQASGEAVQEKTHCPGSIRFSINGAALQNLLTLMRTPSAWKEKIHSFAIASDQKKNIFCINE